MYLYQTGLGVDVNLHHFSFNSWCLQDASLPVELTITWTVSSTSLLKHIIALMSGKGQSQLKNGVKLHVIIKTLETVRIANPCSLWQEVQCQQPVPA